MHPMRKRSGCDKLLSCSLCARVNRFRQVQHTHSGFAKAFSLYQSVRRYLRHLKSGASLVIPKITVSQLRLANSAVRKAYVTIFKSKMNTQQTLLRLALIAFCNSLLASTRTAASSRLPSPRNTSKNSHSRCVWNPAFMLSRGS